MAALSLLKSYKLRLKVKKDTETNSPERFGNGPVSTPFLQLVPRKAC